METLLINYFPAYFKFDFVIYLEGRNTNRFLIYPEKVTKTTKKIREMSIAAFAHLESATHCKRRQTSKFWPNLPTVPSPVGNRNNKLIQLWSFLLRLVNNRRRCTNLADGVRLRAPFRYQSIMHVTNQSVKSFCWNQSDLCHF